MFKIILLLVISGNSLYCPIRVFYTILSKKFDVLYVLKLQHYHKGNEEQWLVRVGENAVSKDNKYKGINKMKK